MPPGAPPMRPAVLEDDRILWPVRRIPRTLDPLPGYVVLTANRLVCDRRPCVASEPSSGTETSLPESAPKRACHVSPSVLKEVEPHVPFIGLLPPLSTASLDGCGDLY